MAEQLAQGNAAIALLGNTFATVFALYVLIETLGPISGAHFNPAVTLFVAWREKWPLIVSLAYVMSQLAGAACGRCAALLGRRQLRAGGARHARGRHSAATREPASCERCRSGRETHPCRVLWPSLCLGVGSLRPVSHRRQRGRAGASRSGRTARHRRGIRRCGHAAQRLGYGERRCLHLRSQRGRAAGAGQRRRGGAAASAGRRRGERSAGELRRKTHRLARLGRRVYRRLERARAAVHRRPRQPPRAHAGGAGWGRKRRCVRLVAYRCACNITLSAARPASAAAAASPASPAARAGRPQSPSSSCTRPP